MNEIRSFNEFLFEASSAGLVLGTYVDSLSLFE